MVMDATQPQQPSPQSVGREFVRQYYTLLNKAPNHLHRFYNNNSSFIHGEAVLVVGQKNIHNRIQQLNFHDCHAKISQVDAQATLGNGVVVQVTGELSNDGQPMRRFTQTFVLAAQSPKKYYVHNDIFRYQDMYSDEENDGETRSELDEEHEQPVVAINEQQTSQQQQAVNVGAIPAEQPQQPQQPLPVQVVAGANNVLPAQQQQQQGAAPQQTIYYSMASAGGRPVPVLASAPLGTPFGATVVAPQGAVVGQVNGVVGTHDDLLAGMQQPNAAQQPLLAQTAGIPIVQSAAPTALASASINVAAVPVIPAVIPQTAANVISGFQQSPMLPPQQQQVIQPPQTVVDVEESNTLTNNVAVATTNPAPLTAAPIKEVTRTPPPVVDDFKTINEQQQQEKYEAAKQMQNEPKTYANLFKSTSSSPCGFLNAAMQQQQQLQQQQQAATNAATNYQVNSTTITTYSQTSASAGSAAITGYNNRNSENNASNRLENNNIGSQSGGPLPQRNNAARINKDYEPRRTSNAQQFGDNQQLFLGNIPHNASEDDLRAIFERYGAIIELRILSKPANKLPPGMRNPLNYGFITYDEPESVQNCLANCPLYYPENGTDSQKLNVEEKKPRMRTNDMAPRQSMGGGNNMNNNMNTQRNNMGGSGGGGGGGQQSRSLANATGGGSMMRGSNNGTGNMQQQRGGTSGGNTARLGGFNRNDGRNGPSNGAQVRGGNNNAQTAGGGGGSGNYASRR